MAKMYEMKIDPYQIFWFRSNRSRGLSPRDRSDGGRDARVGGGIDYAWIVTDGTDCAIPRHAGHSGRGDSGKGDVTIEIDEKG